MMLSSKRKKLSSSKKGKRRAKMKIVWAAILVVFLLMLLLMGRILYRHRADPLFPGCRVLQIWSHRGHLDATTTTDQSLTCDHVLHQLQEAGIRHFDVDVLFVKGASIVAHPTEMSDDLGEFRPSPCSKLTLVDYLHKLKLAYGENNFFLTMEPKSSWKESDVANDFLAPPGDVVAGILDALGEEKIPADHCGIILDEDQLKHPAIAKLATRMNDLCRMTAAPFSFVLAPLNENHVPDRERYTILMPSIEHFRGPIKASSFLQESDRRGLKNIAWVVDTENDLRHALQLQGVHGVISNHPVKLKRMYEETCHIKYSPAPELI